MLTKAANSVGVLNELKSRGVKSVDLFCIDGLSGFREAINAVYPFAGIQRCIIHQIRSSCRYVSYKHIKEFTADLKLVYRALNEEAAMDKLIDFKEKWQKQYPSAVKSWEDNWDILSTFFAYPVETYTKFVISLSIKRTIFYNFARPSAETSLNGSLGIIDL